MKKGFNLSRRTFAAGGLAAAASVFGAAAPARPYRYSGAERKPPTVCWLGINGLELRLPDITVLIDPCVSRAHASPISNPANVARYIGHADAVFLTHSHWDHLIDVPLVVAQTGARVYGSETTLNICRARGVPENKLTLIGADMRLALSEKVAVRIIWIATVFSSFCGIRQSRIKALLSSRARDGRAGRRFRRAFFDARR